MKYICIPWPVRCALSFTLPFGGSCLSSYPLCGHRECLVSPLIHASRLPPPISTFSIASCSHLHLHTPPIYHLLNRLRHRYSFNLPAPIQHTVQGWQRAWPLKYRPGEHAQHELPRIPQCRVPRQNKSAFPVSATPLSQLVRRMRDRLAATNCTANLLLSPRNAAPCIELRATYRRAQAEAPDC